jgi:hypothetical protein
MYRIDEKNNKIVIQPKYIHYDENKYYTGDTIVKHYDIPDDIIEVYNRETGKDIQTIVYMLDHTSDEYMYENKYKYEYEVSSSNPLKCRMDLSALMCMDYLERDSNAKNNRKFFINAIAKAYVYKDLSIVEQTLLEQYINNKVEYIDNNVKVKRILRQR